MLLYALPVLILFDRLVDISLVITVVALYAWYFPPNKAFVAAIVLGFTHDVILALPFGWMSLGMLLLTFATAVLKLRLGSGALVGWLVSVGLAQAGYSFVTTNRLSIGQTLLQLVIVLLLWWISQRRNQGEGVYLR